MRSAYIYLNKLYKTDKALAIQKIKERELDCSLSLQLLSRDFLRDLGIWNDDVKSQIIKYNTATHYTNYRIYDIEFRLMDLLNTYRQEDICFYTCKVDHLILLDFHMSLNENYFNINPVPFFDVLSKGRYFTLDYMKFVKSYSKEHFYKFLKQSPELLKFVLAKDKLLIDDPSFFKGLIGTNSNNIAFLNLPYNEWGSFRRFISDEFIVEYFYKFKLDDLFVLRDYKFIWDILKNQPYKIRYKLYSKMIPNDKVISVVRQDLKNLVKSNYKSISGKYKVHVKDTLSIIKEIVDQIVVFPILVDLVYLVISEMEDMSKDMCMFYILKYISEKSEFVRNDSFCKWYVNIVKLLKLLYKDVDFRALQDLIDLYLTNKKFSAILLVEITGNCKLDNLVEVFLYENYDIKLKEDIFGRYQTIKKPRMARCALKYMTTMEVNKLKTENFKFEYMEEYLYVRNVAKLISNNMDRIKDFECLKEFFSKCCESFEEDIRLIGNSMLSKIEIYKRN